MIHCIADHPDFRPAHPPRWQERRRRYLIESGKAVELWQEFQERLPA